MTQNPESLTAHEASLLLEAHQNGRVLAARGTTRVAPCARLHDSGAFRCESFGDLCGFALTDFGRRWVEALLATPCPEPPPRAIEPGARYRTREGGTARVLCVDRVSVDYPVVALVNPLGPTPRERLVTYTRDGFALIGTSDHYLDLIERIDQP